MLITGKRDAPYSFCRCLRWEDGCWRVIDELHARSWRGVKAIGLGCDQTSIYVAMSRVFQRGQLQPWIDLTEELQKLTPGHPLRIERVL